MGRESRKAGKGVVRHGGSAVEQLPHGTTTVQLTHKPQEHDCNSLPAQLSQPLQRTQQLYIDTLEPLDMPRRRHDVRTGKQDWRAVFGT